MGLIWAVDCEMVFLYLSMKFLIKLFLYWTSVNVNPADLFLDLAVK